jgi:DNA adenine methylase
VIADIDMMTVHVADLPAAPQPQPFPLQGSKRGLVPVITRLIPPDRPRFVEPFCGSAAASIGVRRADLVSDVVLSDANQSLVQLWHEILHRPDRLANEYERIWTAQFDGDQPDARAHFNLVRDQYNAAPSERSAEFLFLLNRIVKGSLRYARNGRMNQSADGRRSGARPDTVRTRIMNTSSELTGADVLCRDWSAAIGDGDATDVIYLDPPYQGTSDTRDQRYIAGMSVEAFERGVADAIDRGLSLMISYDALRGPVIYGRPLAGDLGMLAIDVVTGVSAQGTLLGRRQAAHETIYLSPALVDRLGGSAAVRQRLTLTR